eukprot:gene25076-31490_t
MVQTVEGMVAEQHAIVFAFVLGMCFFVVQTASMYVIMMTHEIGYICFGITMLGGLVIHENDPQNSSDPVAALDALIAANEPKLSRVNSETGVAGFKRTNTSNSVSNRSEHAREVNPEERDSLSLRDSNSSLFYFKDKRHFELTP